MKPYNKSNIPLAKNLRKNMTPWERKLWYEFLRDYPIKFQRQKSIGNYIVDFYCASAKLVIELDGSQHYEDEGLKRDSARDAFLQNAGYTVKRYANRDVRRNFEAVCQEIHLAIFGAELPAL